MMTLNYSITREEASEILGISTRTLDRYIKKGKIGYKKVSNRVLLATEDIEKLKQEFALLNNSYDYAELISGADKTSLAQSTSDLTFEIKQIINQSFEGFMKVLQEKDKVIEEKNSLIISMQSHISNLESKIKNSIPLPDYTKEKDNIVIEKEKLVLENKDLKEKLQKQKTLNVVYFILLVLSILIALVVMFK